MAKKTDLAAEQGARKREAERLRNQQKTRAASEIQEIPFQKINWRRRLRAKNDLMYFAKTYLYNVFYRKPAGYHQTLATAIKDVVESGGRQSILLPRGGGKTMWCIVGALHGLLFGHVKWVFFIAANKEKGIEGMQTFLTWLKSPIVQEDFPELVYPYALLDTAEPGSVARSQTYGGHKTQISVAPDEFRFPCVLLDAKTYRTFRRHDADSVREVQHPGQKPIYLPAGACGIFSSTGIECSIRGSNVQNPYTFESYRPNICILDDIQNDKVSRSKMSVQKYKDIIDGAISYLAAGGETIGLLMPATVIESDDLADRLGDRMREPEWRGIRIPMVQKWPDGMNNTEITKKTLTARLWQEYEQERQKSLKATGTIAGATKFYRKNRYQMDLGFEVSWAERYAKNHLSAVQEAMEFRFSNHKAFLSNCQQVGGDVLSDAKALVSARDLTEKQGETPKGVVPEDTLKIVGFVDIQDEYFAYVILAISDNFTSTVIDYGTYPDTGRSFYRRRQVNEWKLLTTAYLKENPTEGLIRDSTGREVLNAVDMYTWNLTNFLQILHSQRFEREKSGTFMHMNCVGVDVQDGVRGPIVRDVLKKFPPGWAVPYHGMGIRANQMGIDTIHRQPNSRYEDIQNPNANTCRWVYRFYVQSKMYELLSDVNAWKDFLFQRLETPAGSAGSLVLFKAPPHVHELFAVQVCESEKPTEFIAQGKKRNLWSQVPGMDNEFLDCLTGCCALASLEGCIYHPDDIKLNVKVNLDGAPPPKSFKERLNAMKSKGLRRG